jgi:UDP-N-acetylmuramate dehydrogenase
LAEVNFQQNVPLSLHTTFKIGGPAQFFCEVFSLDELTEAIDFALEHDVDYFILSGGSNLIISDAGFPGLVIKLNFNEIDWQENKIVAGAGLVLNDLVTETTRRGWSGLEWAGGLPGTLGGAIRGNAGAFSGETKDDVKNVTSFKQGEGIIIRDNKDCNFNYRTSIYKHSPEIILKAELVFKSDDPQHLIEIADARRQYRITRHPMEYPSSGSIFKNIPAYNVSNKALEDFGEVIKDDPFPVIPTAAVLANLKLSGYTVGGAQVSTKHPNYIVNIGGAKGQDVIEVIQYVVARVMTEYDIQLEVEPQLVGFKQRYSWESL